MPDNHGIRVMIGNDDANLRYVWAAHHAHRRHTLNVTSEQAELLLLFLQRLFIPPKTTILGALVGAVVQAKPSAALTQR